ncbi:hypothetical protein OT109_07400 [Phycisphaeraceae bacterium D3-23]
MPTPTQLLIPLVAAGLFFAAPIVAQDVTTPEDQGVVDLFFRDKITAVRRTRDIEDDAMLIAEMVEKAREVPDSPGVQRRIYETGIELGMSTGAYAAAIDAALQLRKDFPGAAMASDDVLLGYYAEAYRETRRTDRAEIAEPYLALMVQMAEDAESSGDAEAAEDLYSDALTIARSVRSPLEEMLEANMERINAVAQIVSRMRVLHSALEVNDRNTSAARELTMLYVLHRRDLSAAAQVVGMTQDPDLIDAVRMSAVGPAAASPADALRVADWYVGLADQEREMSEHLLAEAARYYDRFLDAYPRQDALFTWVSKRRDDAQERLDAIHEAAERLTRGEWRSILEQINPQRHAILDTPTVRNGQIAVANSGFVIPFQPEGNYDIRIRVRFDRGEDGIIFYLPLGEASGAVYQYSRWDHTRIQIDGVEETEEERFMLTRGREVELGIEVRVLRNGRASVVGYVDGEACIRWSGDIEDLEVDEAFVPSDRHGNAIAVRCDGRYVFRSIEVREPVE